MNINSAEEHIHAEHAALAIITTVSATDAKSALSMTTLPSKGGEHGRLGENKTRVCGVAIGDLKLAKTQTGESIQ